MRLQYGLTITHYHAFVVHFKLKLVKAEHFQQGPRLIDICYCSLYLGILQPQLLVFRVVRVFNDVL